MSQAGVAWAGRFVLYLTRQMLWRAAQHVSETEFHARCNRMLEVLTRWQRRKGDGGMGRLVEGTRKGKSMVYTADKGNLKALAAGLAKLTPKK